MKFRNMTEVSDHNPTGYRIDSFKRRFEECEIVGDASSVVAAELFMTIPPLGIFSVKVVTRSHYGDERVEAIFSDLQDPTQLLNPDTTIKEPFVINDRRITEEGLSHYFKGRRVEPALADSMWYEGPLPAEGSRAA
jgi:hypothetical protein